MAGDFGEVGPHKKCHQLIGPVEKEHFCGFGFGLIFCGGLGL
jgi:hypothetical protein